MAEISRKTLLNLILQWESGRLTEIEVHQKAEELWKQENWPDYADDNPRSIAIEVLLQLETLNHQLITKDDLPAIVGFLNTPKGAETSGWSTWRNYWESLDLESRKATLKDHPYYST